MKINCALDHNTLWISHASHIKIRTKYLSKLVWRENSSNFSYISFLSVNFENLTVEFHVSYVLNMHIKFHSNWILFTIWSINLFFIYNFRLQKLKIITFIWWHSNWFLIFLKFGSIKDVISTCNLTVRFSKFTLNIKIYDEFVWFLSKLIWRETLFHPI